MITDLYAPTRGIDFLRITCVTDTPAPVRLLCLATERSVEPLRAPVRCEGHWYWRYALDDLSPGQNYRLLAEQDMQRGRSLNVSTLARPAGERRLRLGIIADPHCTERQSTASRLYGASFDLFAQTLQHLVSLGAQSIIVPGDLADEGTTPQLSRCRRIMGQSPVPVYPLVGNHDYQAQRFLDAFGLTTGYRSLDIEGIHLVLLHTQSAADLSPQSAQLRWLRADLADHQDQDTFVFSHYPLVDHPYHLRESNRCVHNWRTVSALLGRQRRVRAAFAGHKNVPTRTDAGGVSHIVCPQTLRAPCGYDVVDIYDGGFTRTVYEIAPLDLLAQAREGIGRRELHYRHGLESGRNFAIHFDGVVTDSPATASIAATTLHP